MCLYLGGKSERERTGERKNTSASGPRSFGFRDSSESWVTASHVHRQYQVGLPLHKRVKSGRARSLSVLLQLQAGVVRGVPNLGH